MSNRVRYGKIKTERTVMQNKLNTRIITEVVPKNTLYTIRDDNDLIHFGIARCNTFLGDRFNKSTGTLIATNRARLAASEAGVGGIPGKQLKSNDIPEEILLHRSGLRGTVKVENIVSLLKYFDNIDTVMLPERLKPSSIGI